MILRICAGLVLLLTGFVSPAQTKVTINGYVKDSASGESIIGASITVDGKAVGSNQYGFYSITLDTGEYDLSAGVRCVSIPRTFRLRVIRPTATDRSIRY